MRPHAESESSVKVLMSLTIRPSSSFSSCVLDAPVRRVSESSACGAAPSAGWDCSTVSDPAEAP